MRQLFLLLIAILLGAPSGRSTLADSIAGPGFWSLAPQERALPISRGKKLFLTDGTFQMVRDWELVRDPTGEGRDRVRYYSVERSKYEELPAELVDFDATRRAEQEQAEREADLREEMESRRVAQLATEIDVDASIEVAPGLFLPDDVGMWVLEPKQGGGDSPILLPLTQVNATSRVDKGRLLTQIFVPIPVVPGKHKVEIAGNRAVLRIRHLNPEFYIRTEDKREPEMELIRVKVKGDKREVEVVKTYITGEKLEERKTVSVERWPVARGVFRLTLSQPLSPGEYVLAEILPGEGINLYVWDFGIDP